MFAKIGIYDWRDIMRVCGTIAATAGADHAVLGYIDLVFHAYNQHVTAYGCNNTQVSKITVPCEMSDIPDDYNLLIPPLKIPAHTRSVEIHIDQKVTIIFIDAEDEIIDTFESDFFDGAPMDYEMFYKKARDNFDAHNHGKGQYCIAVNPKLLINALDGMKSCETVILNFGSMVQPFTIRPYGDDMNATALIFPKRVML